MPRNLEMPWDVEPINFPLSSVTVVAQVVGMVEMMEITAQSVTRDARRKPILAFETIVRFKIRRGALGSIPEERAHVLSRVDRIWLRDDPGFPRKFKFS
jgi:hypothetical protein